MKNLKSAVLSMLMLLFLITSCTNNEPFVEDEQQTEESSSITEALNELKSNFDEYGNVTQTSNPAGNVVFDFCFDFVYPLTISYNNGTTVTIADLDGLVDVMINSTDNLYVNGIAFPFNVETYNENTNTIEIVTINNEEEFISLLDTCTFDDLEICDCSDELDPVCVEIIDPNGDTFTMTYPNACYAECDGFTDDDFLESCEEDYNPGGGVECFTLNYPFSIIVDDETTITINSEEEFGNVLYNVYNFDFVYPFTVTLEDETVATINSSEDIEVILTDCYGDFGGGNDCTECEDEPVDPVCIEYVSDSGETIIEVFPNMCVAECLGFTENNVVDCNDDNEPADCSEDGIVAYFTDCDVWYSTSSLTPNSSAEFNFNADGTVTASMQNNAYNGTWSLSSNPQSGEVFMFISLPEPFDGISNLDWTVAQCSENFIMLESNNEFLSFESACD
ncbi:MAG: hypothetical protein ACPGUH_03050 [Winogradskyella sp.]